MRDLDRIGNCFGREDLVSAEVDTVYICRRLPNLVRSWNLMVLEMIGLAYQVM